MKLNFKIVPIVVLSGVLFYYAFSKHGDSPEAVSSQLNQRALIIDVRTAGEFSDKHIDGAVNIPYDVIAREIVDYETDVARPIILYCRSGNRSSHAKRFLAEIGYTNVVDAGSYGNMKKLYDNALGQPD